MNKELEIGNLKSYLSGFILSILLTLLAFFLVSSQAASISRNILIAGVIALAFVQLLVQLILFLHVGQGKQPLWNLVMVITTAGAMFILIAGSIWIMNHLNYNMTPDQIHTYVVQQGDGGI